MGIHFGTAEQFSWLLKLYWIMVASDPGVTAQEFADALPSFEEVLTMVNSGHGHSWFHLLCSNWNLPALLAEACEKLGLHDQALSYAEQAATNTDITQGGTFLPSVQWRGLRTKAKCLVAMGKPKEAEEAFEAALASIDGFEYFLLEILCVRDLKVLVLDTDGRGDEGSARLNAAIHQLLGETPAPEQLAELAVALGDSIDLAAVLA